ncbi:SDR family NAD(P)-dependent oxidoreductase [Saccharibacillus sp. CPCC 101409]|uniref:SDR family oxidoreductase n=1 Tax=Saccharibacillus sp. CPCC 101409 TaxID=3058041 RepID=UPI002670E8AA|nr:SDR family NAD(P)-dependent oxidoreductase [Saccharibacillus sp. CPCC 101409]MDO3411689.1 SDR family NAD(P)-dependent oxidoreductase [Saccharibacillus sp. CPCC 101409]
MSATRFEGRTVIVTGAGSGIGRAAALKFASEGANVGLFDLDSERAESVRGEVEDIRRGAGLVCVVDVSDPLTMEQSFNAVVERFGGLDAVFANAGINGAKGPIEHMELAEFQRTIDVNLGGMFLSVKLAVPHMKKRGGGSIVITSSVNGNTRFSSIGMSPYSTSKAGQVAFAKMAALELARYKIRVNAICPGAISTNIDETTDEHDLADEIAIPLEFPRGGDHPLAGRHGLPEEVADLAVYLASSEARHVTGASITVDGGESLLF